MNFNDKFLNVCFKIGKVFLSIALVLVVLAGFGILYKIANDSVKMNNIPLEYKFSDEPIDDEAESPKIDTKAEKEKISKQYKEKIVTVLKEQKVSEKVADTIINDMVSVEERDRADYVAHLGEYYVDLTKFFTDNIKKEFPNITEYQIAETFKYGQLNEVEIPSRYLVRYNRQIELRKAEHDRLQAERLVYLWALLAVICMFVMFLIVPILIRIEENTRK